MTVNGVNLQEVYYHDGKRKNARGTRDMINLLNEISKDKKLVMVEGYVEKNRHICDFYRKCSLAGFMCEVFDPTLNSDFLEYVRSAKYGIRIPF